MKHASIATPARSPGTSPTSFPVRAFASTEPAAAPTLSVPDHGHDFARVSVARPTATPSSAPAASLGATVQRVKARPIARPEDRMKRWATRGGIRKKKRRLPTGRYATKTGDVTVSGLFGQRMTQAQKGDYGGESLGSVPSYAAVRDNLPDSALGALLGKKVGARLTHKQRLAAALGSALIHVSEEDREPGASKVIRALTRSRMADSSATHPLDPAVNPAVGKKGAQKMRDLLQGKIPLSKEQSKALIDHASESSGDDDPHSGFRLGVVKKKP